MTNQRRLVDNVTSRRTSRREITAWKITCLAESHRDVSFSRNVIKLKRSGKKGELQVINSNNTTKFLQDLVDNPYRCSPGDAPPALLLINCRRKCQRPGYYSYTRQSPVKSKASEATPNTTINSCMNLISFNNIKKNLFSSTKNRNYDINSASRPTTVASRTVHGSIVSI